MSELDKVLQPWLDQSEDPAAPKGMRQAARDAAEAKADSPLAGVLGKWLAGGESPRWKRAAGVAIDGKSHALNVINELREAGVGPRVIMTPKTDEVTAAHSMPCSPARPSTR